MNIRVAFTNGTHEYIKNVHDIQEFGNTIVKLFTESGVKEIDNKDIKDIVVNDFFITPPTEYINPEDM